MTRVAYTLEQCWHRVPGGTAASALGTARALAARGDVELVGVSARHRRPPAAPWVPPVPVRQLPLPRPLLYECWHTLRAARVDRATGRVDVIHATGMAVPPRSAPLVVTVHDLAFLKHREYGTPNGQRFFRRSLDLARRDADLVLCPSEATRQDCIANGIRAERVRVVPWGVEAACDRVPIDPASIGDRLARFGLADTPYVLWVGTIEPRKNLTALVEAFARIKARGVLLAVVGPAGWNEDLRARLAPIAARTRVLGFVDADDLRLLHQQAAVFCYPSLYEGFGMPVLEAMAAGTAVVTSRGTATEEVLGDAGLAVDPRDPAAIADAITALLDDPARRAILGAAAAARAATFTWERTAALTSAAYEAVRS
ncbi:MAG TPA: glycosyltransferase family 1 protein [Acidimicrobiales bacterium]|jgi:glycosyltransferase involved in cell wall biosynthesis|nr:glycosyltransferase family 1 protein [Acidimicrobiales bacterium]